MVKHLFLALFLILCIAFVFTDDADEDDRIEWDIFKATYNKKYDNDDLERKAFQNFIKNQRSAVKASTKSAANPNNKDPAKFGINEFSDLSTEDFLSKYTGRKPHDSAPRSGLPTRKYSASDLSVNAAATEIDWSKTKYMAPVRQQGDCGSCWTYAATATLESYWGILYDKTPSHFSTQQLVDCVTQAYGCNGGNAQTALDYVIRNGVVFDTKYPYQERNGRCQTMTGDFKIDAQGSTNPYDENAIIAALQKQPLAVAVNANGNWQRYTGGIMDGGLCSSNSADINHAVTLVGYGPNYWKIKNSWGEGWGEGGYIRLARGDTCGVTQDVAWPIKNSAGPTPGPTPGPNPGPTPTPTPTPTPVSCKDQIACCSDLSRLGYCNANDQSKFEAGFNLCQKTCNACPPPNGSACKDRASNCYQNTYYCSTGTIQYYCPKTCGICY